MIRGPPRSTLDRSSAASDVYKRQRLVDVAAAPPRHVVGEELERDDRDDRLQRGVDERLSLIHISEPTRPY